VDDDGYENKYEEEARAEYDDDQTIRLENDKQVKKSQSNNRIKPEALSKRSLSVHPIVSDGPPQAVDLTKYKGIYYGDE